MLYLCLGRVYYGSGGGGGGGGGDDNDDALSPFPRMHLFDMNLPVSPMYVYSTAITWLKLQKKQKQSAMTKYYNSQHDKENMSPATLMIFPHFIPIKSLSIFTQHIYMFSHLSYFGHK